MASTDGTQFAVGPDVGDVKTGEVVASFPQPGVFAAAWLDEGIVYVKEERKATDTRMWLWQPGSEPKETFLFEVASVHGGIAVTTNRHCAAAGPLSEPPSAYQRFCHGRVLSISPNGERVFTESFEVVDVATGEATPLPVPEFDRPLMSYWDFVVPPAFWEDENHLVLRVPGREGRFSFVRCDLPTDTCERASDQLDGDLPPLELSPLD